ncbi:Rhodanese Domain Protein [Bacteroidales bacterium CF]|jgi:rhodanese-related sulfurtransferase|nr:Rhodanese Domain Protein [Bacteroidales bacterium CF]
MPGFFSNLFKMRDDADYAALVKNGAVIVDVRTTTEYNLYGHIKGSVNIPLDELAGKISRLDKSKPVITVCQSGARSKSASSYLSKLGYEVYNGGSWNTFSV